MSESAPSSPPPPVRRTRRRRIAMSLAGVVSLAAIALVAAALIPGSHAHGDDGLARADVATRSTATATPVRATKVVGSSISARDYGTKISEMENGTNAQGRMISDLSPVPARRFRRPIARFRSYAERWAGRLQRSVTPLTAALRAGDRDRARGAWDASFSDYLHLGAVYGLLPGDLNDDLAGLPARIGSRRFVGLHRIEMGLWTGAPTSSLVVDARRLRGATARLRRTLPTVPIDTLDFTLRAHEILEDAQRDLMSGAQVPWSHAGVLGTAAGTTATRELVTVLGPLLQGRDNTLGEAQYWLGRLSATERSLRRHDGAYPTLGQLTDAEHERLDAVLAGTLGALQEIPGTLETTALPDIPKDPATP